MRLQLIVNNPDIRAENSIRAAENKIAPRLMPIETNGKVIIIETVIFILLILFSIAPTRTYVEETLTSFLSGLVCWSCHFRFPYCSKPVCRWEQTKIHVVATNIKLDFFDRQKHNPNLWMQRKGRIKITSASCTQQVLNWVANFSCLPWKVTSYY